MSLTPSARPGRSGLLTILLLSLVLGCGGASDDVSQDDTVVCGVFEAYSVEHGDGSARAAYALRTGNDERVELSFASAPALSSGEQVALRGHFVANDEPLSSHDDLRLGSTRFVVESAVADSLGTTEQALLNPPKVTVRAAVVLLNFRGLAAQSYTADKARSELATVRDYYDEMSYGSWTMDSKVFGPYLVDAPSECNLNTVGALGKQAARDHGVDIDSFDHVGVKIGGIPGLTCPCGVAYIGGTPAEGKIRNGSLSLYTCGGPNAYAHEMGHGIGLNHSSTAPCNGKAYRPGLEGCNIIEYGNHYNTMGNGLGHFNAMQKATLGWLNGCNVQRVSRTAEFDLTAIQVAANNQTTQALQIDTGDMRNGAPLYFYVEYRNPALATFNAEQDGKVRELGPGLHVTVSRDFRAKQGEGRTILIDASQGLKGLPGSGKVLGDPRVQVGETFRPNDRVSIQLVSGSERVARVKVTFSGGGTGQNTCQTSGAAVAPTPPVPGPAKDVDAGRDAGHETELPGDEAGVAADYDASLGSDPSLHDSDAGGLDPGGAPATGDGDDDAGNRAPNSEEDAGVMQPPHPESTKTAAGCSASTARTSPWPLACLFMMVLARRRRMHKQEC